MNLVDGQVNMDVVGIVVDDADALVKDRPTDALLSDLRQHKAEIITELERLQRLWLERVAGLLKVTPDELLQRSFVESCDMQEQWHTEPIHAARLINSYWPAPTSKTGQALP